MTSKNTSVPLVKNTIDKQDIESLIEWLKTEPQLTKGPMVMEFEKKWSEWLGKKYSVSAFYFQLELIAAQ